MAYENDIIMRQVRDMTRMLAKILFGKNTATYEYKERIVIQQRTVYMPG